MLSRLKLWLMQMLISIDQLAYVWLKGWTFVWLGRGKCPDADETISSFVGRRAVAGKPWALILERIIDRIFWFDPDHCRGSIERIERLALLSRIAG